MTREKIAAVYDVNINEYVYCLEIVNGYHVISIDTAGKIRKASTDDTVYVLKEYERIQRRKRRTMQPYRPMQ